MAVFVMHVARFFVSLHNLGFFAAISCFSFYFARFLFSFIFIFNFLFFCLKFKNLRHGIVTTKLKKRDVAAQKLKMNLNDLGCHGCNHVSLPIRSRGCQSLCSDTVQSFCMTAFHRARPSGHQWNSFYFLT